MPTYEISTPDGQVFEIDAPDEAAGLQAIQGAQQPVSAEAAQEPAATPQPVGPIPGERRQSNIFPVATVVGPEGEVNTELDFSAGIIGDIVDAVTLPEDVFRGRVDPMSPEGMERTTNLAFGALPVARMGAKVARPAPPRPVVKSTEELAAATNAVYQQARDVGLQLSEAGYARLAQDVINSVKGQAFSPRKHPNIQSSLLEIRDRLGGQQTLDQIDVLRQLMRDLPNTATKAERRLAKRMVDALDDRLAKLPERDVVAGDPKAAVSALTAGRQLAATRFKAEMIDDMMEKAANSAGGFTGSGFENAVRGEFRRLANNKKLFRRFAPHEKKAIQDVARKGKVAQNIGKVAPTGGLSIVLNAMAAGINPWFALMTSAGVAGRVAATRGTARRVKRVREAIQTQENPRASKRAVDRATRSIDAVARRPLAVSDALEGQQSVGPLGP